MLRAVPDAKLDEVLSSVSRSFYLSLAILPRSVRAQLGSAYLVARAADTIADTHLIPATRRLELLAGLRTALLDGQRADALADEVRRELLPEGAADEGGDATRPALGSTAERRLLERFDECLATLRRQEGADRVLTRRVLDSLITGMERDLERFPDGPRAAPRALRTMAELDEHTYLAAGCVGEYWTAMTAAHIEATRHFARPDLMERGVRLGKALQLINIIRDAPADLAAGRCYFPLQLLDEHRLTPADLIGAGRQRARWLVDEMRRLALEHVDAAWPYVMALPPRAPRLRLACIWPLWIGLATLERLAALDDPLAPGPPVKVPRKQVYALIAESLAAVSIDPLLSRRHWRRRARAGRFR